MVNRKRPLSAVTFANPLATKGDNAQPVPMPNPSRGNLAVESQVYIRDAFAAKSQMATELPAL